ncbi:MAG: hypothetical protein J6O71_04895 [Lachnospiraceae bacterium]|nr:hypothetical protein [Lachnospiraceae bacterium]
MARIGKNIYQRKDGRYEGRYITGRDENGKSKYAYVYGKTSHEVEARLMEIRSGLEADRMQGKTTFAQIARKWLDSRREKLSEASVDRYGYLLDKYVIPEFGGKDVEAVTMVQVSTYVNELSDKGKYGDAAIRGSIVRRLLSITGSVLAFAQDGIGGMPARNSERFEKHSYEPLSDDELRRLIACTRYNRNEEMLGVMLSLFTGIGTGEICALSWDDFDIGRREISISHTLYRIRNNAEGKEEGGNRNRTRLSVMNVRRSSVRSVQYPEELDNYVRDFYKKGCVFLTGERDRYLEQRTFCNHLENAFRLYALSGVTIARIKKTYEEGLADIRYLSDPFYMKGDGAKVQIQARVDEKWLVKEMENDLLPLRMILGFSSSEMGIMMGISKEEYEAIEAGEVVMGWDMFLSLLFLFKYNSKTESVVDALGLYPNALRERIESV